MAHVEELRQIHADINAMESIIKQSEDSRRNAQVSLKFEIVNESNLCSLGQSEETIVFGVSDYTILHQLHQLRRQMLSRVQEIEKVSDRP